MMPISLGDQLKLTVQTKLTGQALSFSKSGDLEHLSFEQDLTIRACQLFFKHAGLPDHFHVHLHVDKQIPEQAGLGGGSSNAAQVLSILQTQFKAPLSTTDLNRVALQLGADVPFFLQPSAAFIEGIGEKITPIFNLSQPLIVYKPPQNCPTSKIFQAKELTRDKTTVKISLFDLLRTINQQSGESTTSCTSNFWQFLSLNTENCLQTVVALLEPDWQKHYNMLVRSIQSKKPLLVRMTGSGSAIFAVFENELLQQQAFEQLSHLPGRAFCCHAFMGGVNSG